jgi:hypothetical protein
MIRRTIKQFEKIISEQEKQTFSRFDSLKEIYFMWMLDYIKPLNADEILFLAKLLNKDYTNSTGDAIHAILSSSEFPVREILQLENFNDSLLELKADLANDGIAHKLSYYNDIYINKENFKEVLLDTDSIKLSTVDIDYIFAIELGLNYVLGDENILSTLKRCIRDSRYDYLSYFSTEGIIAAERLGLNIGDNESSISHKVNVKGIFAG